MTKPEAIHIPTLEWKPDARGLEACALDSEWLLPDGLGGFAFGTVADCNTRKYHGLLVPNLENVGRTIVLSRLDDELEVSGRREGLWGVEHDGGVLQLPGLMAMKRFWLDGLMPCWELSAAGTVVERRIVRVHGTSTVCIVYTHKSGPDATLWLRPWPSFRAQDHDPQPHPPLLPATLQSDGLSIALGEPGLELKLVVRGDQQARWHEGLQISAPNFYRIDAARGHPAPECLQSPGTFEVALKAGNTVMLAATVDGWDALALEPHEVVRDELDRERSVLSRCPEKLRQGFGARLALAAEAFIIDPPMRRGDSLSVIAGYPWFTDWGRDTMISLEGLTLCTHRWPDAAAILKTFQHHVCDGLVPNYFPEGGKKGVYHTADATLWFFHAVERYLAWSKDHSLLKTLWPTLVTIIDKHLEGTHYGIRVDPRDGLLTQGQAGYQLTWMDAKVGDWVVTPRRGKAVELQGLWFNALKLMAGWADEMGAEPSVFAAHAERCRESFNARFFNERTGCLFDVVDGENGDEPSIRPNQVFTVSLKHPVLESSKWKPVLETVRRELLTPVGLRTLSPHHPDFKPNYAGDLRSRDAAYHQGTVWPWLLGHFYDALKKANPGEVNDAALLNGLEQHVGCAGLGSISEIFDATEPWHPRGCVAQAWSVAEVIRILMNQS